MSVHDFEADSTGEIVHVARAPDGRILGFVSVYEPEAFIHLLFVAPGYERQGIGIRLLDRWKAGSHIHTP